MLPPGPRRPCTACNYDLQGLRGRTHCPSCNAPLPPDLRDPDPPRSDREARSLLYALLGCSPIGIILILALLATLIIVFYIFIGELRVVEL